MRLHHALVLGASWLALSAAAQAQETSPVQAGAEDPRDTLIRELAARIEALEAQVGDLAERSSAGTDDVRRIVAEAPQVTINNGRPQIASANGDFRVAFRGLFQFDAASYFQDDASSPDNRRSGATTAEGLNAGDLSSGVNFRRARIGLEGTAFRDWNYALTYEAGGSGTETAGLQQAWIEYAGLRPFGLENPLRVRVGAYAWPTGLEDATSNSDSVFLERGAPVELVRGLAGGDGRTGVGLFANGARWSASAALTGPLIGNTGEFDEQTALIGRLAFLPLRSENAGVHIGANVHQIFQLPDTTAPGTGGATNIRLRERPELRVDGTRLVDTGNLSADSVLAYGVEIGAQWRGFLATGEWVRIDVDRPGALPDPDFGGFYVQTSYVLTGEQRRWNAATGGFGGVRPANPLNPSEGHWGAFEVAARYSLLDLNFNEGGFGLATPAGGVRGGEQEIISLGLNWYPNAVIRFLLDYQFVEIDRLNPSAAIFTTTPLNGAQIGQDYQVLSLRSQLAF